MSSCESQNAFEVVEAGSGPNDYFSQYFPQSNYDQNSQAEQITLQQPFSGRIFCQAIFFYHHCGCRSLKPVITCQPGIGYYPLIQNSCEHAKPTLVAAHIPKNCGGKIGNTEACFMQDPGSTEFLADCDSANPLDLVVLDECPFDNLPYMLPVKAKDMDDVMAHYTRIHPSASKRKTKKKAKAVEVAKNPVPEESQSKEIVADKGPAAMLSDLLKFEDAPKVENVLRPKDVSNPKNKKMTAAELDTLLEEFSVLETVQQVGPEKVNNSANDEFEQTIDDDADLLDFWADEQSELPERKVNAGWGISSVLGRWTRRA
ncbi:hypothetical protein F5Y16DRAFT_400635 [Xylariaceae sp. FL0255]|nr:hypothetical protein F5Y16DRAFT_400635 [Xylariaceae sp. FL0255]